jgi:hypothetical protein
VSSNKFGLAVGSALAAGGLLLGGSALANAATSTTSAATSTVNGYSAEGSRGPGGGSADTQVTGSEAAKVTAAVKAKDSSVTVSSVRKDADGSYDALGTKSGSQVMFDVSADLKTISQNTFGGGQHGDAPSAPSASNSSTTSTT